MADILASVAVAIGAELSGFDRGMANVRKELAGLVKLGDRMKDFGQTLSVSLTAPLAVFAGLTAKTAGDFEAGMNRVQVATQAPAAAFDQLKKKAAELGANTKFSATEAAEGMESLAKNGLNADQILGGAVDSALALAAATGSNLATSADIATDVMNNFGKSASELSGLIDGITGTTIASKFGIDDYRLALGQAGGVAGALGVKFEDFNTALGVTSSAFSSGSDAGTAFKTFLQRLVPQSKEAAAQIDKLGLKFFDAQGQMLPLRDIAGQLGKAFNGLSDQQKNQAATTIFGSDALRTALLLAKAGTQGFDDMAVSIGKVNAAANAQQLTKGFNGAVEELSSAFEGLQLAIADSGLGDFATRAVQALTEFVRSLSALNPEILRFGTVVAGAAAAIGPLSFAIGSVLAALPALKLGLQTIGLTSTAALGPIALTVAAVAGAAALIIANWDDIVTYFTSGDGGVVFGELATAVKGAVSAMNAAFQSLNAEPMVRVSDIGKGLAAVFEEVARVVTAALNSLSGGLRSFAKLADGDILGFINEQGKGVEGMFRALTGEVKHATKSFDEFFGFSQQVDDAMVAGAVAGNELSGALEGVAVAAGAAAQALSEDQVKALEKVRASFVEIANLSRALGQDRGTRIVGDDYDYVGARAKALEDAVKTLTAAGFAPGSKVVQGYVAELRNLQAVLGATERLTLNTQGVKLNFNTDSGNAVENLKQQVTAALNAVKPSEVLDTSLQRFRLALSQPFDVSGLQQGTAAAAAAYAALPAAQRAALDEMLLRQTEFNTNIEALYDSFGSYVSGFTLTVADSLGAALGAIVANGASVGDGLQLVFSGIIGALADFAGQFGKQLIAIGIGKLSLDKLFTSPAGGPAAIAAGIGLVALAGVAKAVSANAAKSIGAIGSGGSASGAGVPFSPRTPAPVVAAAASPVQVTHIIKLTADGADLAASYEIHNTRSGYINGR